jgi:hypothetical protein
MKHLIPFIKDVKLIDNIINYKFINTKENYKGFIQSLHHNQDSILDTHYGLYTIIQFTTDHEYSNQLISLQDLINLIEDNTLIEDNINNSTINSLMHKEDIHIDLIDYDKQEVININDYLDDTLTQHSYALIKHTNNRGSYYTRELIEVIIARIEDGSYGFGSSALILL